MTLDARRAAARIGNDVVDLGDPESAEASLHPRFDDRVFAATERAEISVSSDANCDRWQRWAAKEAAYKLARKRAPRTIFSPQRFVTEWPASSMRRTAELEFEVRVRHEDDRFDVSIRRVDDAIYAVATLAGTKPAFVVHDLRTLAAPLDRGDPEAPSRAVRALLVERVAPLLGVPPERLDVRREDRIPTLWVDGERSDVDVSLSHHGRYVAFGCAWDGEAADRLDRATSSTGGIAP